MRVAFRQGVVQAPPSFLQLTPAQGVTLNGLPTQAVIATFAQGSSNYLITVKQQVTNAWAGPFQAGTDYWLYFDLDVLSGALTYNHTALLPIVSPSAPLSPQLDQHWFDTNTFQMKVWSGSRWVNRVRVFAAKLQGGTVFISMSIYAPGSFLGTQIGFPGQVSCTAGAILFDVFGMPIRKSQNTFFTTEDYAVAGAGSAVQVKTGSLLVEAVAWEPLPAFYVVRFVDYTTVALAKNFLLDNGLYGIVEVGVDEDDTCSVVMEGVVHNPNWNWSAYPVNTPLYVGPTGELTTVPPPIKIPIAAVIDRTTILLRPSSFFLGGQIQVASQMQLGNVLISGPSVPPPAIRNIISVVSGANGTFTITGNYAEDLMISRQVTISGNGDPATNQLYYVYSATNVGVNTVITVSEPAVPYTAVAGGAATFSQLPRVITQDDPRLGAGSGFTPLATDSLHGIVRLDAPATNPLDPVVLTPVSQVNGGNF